MRPKAIVRPLELPPGRRVLIVSDIHGNLPLLQEVLAKAKFSKEDVLVVLGDILERSAGSLDTLRYVMALSEAHTVLTLRGNCDDILLRFLDGSLPDTFLDRWLGRLGRKSVIVDMCARKSMIIRGPADYPAARALIAREYAPEVAFVAATPHILVNDQYLLVHGGVPREERLEELDAYSCMKNDDFLGQNLSFQRWVVVGHWPVTLYDPAIPSAAPIILPDRRIISIDGGCTLKWDGQLNVLILPQRAGEGFSWVSADGLPTVTALDSQEANQNSINIRWSEHAIEVLEEGPEFCRCRHLASGRELDILAEYIYDLNGVTICEDYTDYRLSVQPGDTLAVVRKTSRGLLAKKDGVTGWYSGRYQ